MKRRAKKRPRGFGSVFLMGRIWWIRPPGGKRESSRSVRKGDAEALLQSRLDELRLGRQPGADPTRATYEDLEGMLLADLRANRRRSIRNVEKFRLPHLRRFFGGMLASRIEYDVVTSYIARRLEEAAPATVLYETKLLKRMLRISHLAKKVGSVPALPTVSVGDNSRKGFATPEEIERVIDHLPNHAKPVVQMMYATGWRVGEILKLEWARVDFESGMIRLDAEQSKSGRARVFPFGALPALADLLREQRARTSALELRTSRIIPTVFWSPDGAPLRSIRTGWRSAVKAAGIPALVPHDLRRSAARNLVRAGVSQHVAMALLGHSTDAMFRRYDITAAQDLVDGVGRLNDFLEQRRTSAMKRRAEH